MKNYKHLISNIRDEFNKFMSDFLVNNGERRKYYYWDLDYFITIGTLSFEYFRLNQEQKKMINSNGLSYFENEEITFAINPNSHRHDITIKNITKLYSDDIKGQKETSNL